MNFEKGGNPLVKKRSICKPIHLEVGSFGEKLYSKPFSSHHSPDSTKNSHEPGYIAGLPVKAEPFTRSIERTRNFQLHNTKPIDKYKVYIAKRKRYCTCKIFPHTIHGH